MLQAIRDRAQGWFAWVIVLMITVPFAFWGIDQYSGGGAEERIATVNGEDIPANEWLAAYRQQRAQIQSMLGGDIDPALMDEKRMKREVLEQMIDNKLLDVTVVDAGYGMSDAVLGMRIQTIPAFQREGSFSAELYNAQLANQGMSPAMFEARMRNSLLVNQLRAGIIDSAMVTDAMLTDYLRLRDQTRDVSYALIPLSLMEEQTTVSEVEVAAEYDQNKDRYQRPEQVRLEYIEFSVAGLAEKVQPDESKLRSYYEQQKHLFGSEEQRRARHILVQLPPDADADTKTKAEQRLADIQAKLKAGGKFEDLAKANSDDTASAVNGGDLGFFGKGIMDPAFEQAVFALKTGEVSDVVTSAFGLHLIKLEEIQAAKIKPFEEVRERLAADYRREQAEHQYYEQVDKLLDVAYEHADSLQPAADLLQLEVKTSDWISQAQGDGIGEHARVREAAFAPEVLGQGTNSDAIEVGPNHVVFVRVKEHREAAQQSLDEVRDQIRATLRSKQAHEKVRAKGEDWVQRLGQGESLQVLASELKLDVQVVKGLRRDTSEHPQEVAEAAFALGPVDGEPVYRGLDVNAGDYAVVMVSAVQQGDPSKVTGEERLAYLREIGRSYGDEDFEALLTSLRANATIEIAEQKLASQETE